ncbi:peptidoglycan editing factor PgeF [Shewanella sp. Isolate11]|uniref:peptidoglycan editing factor PgeF n=1 Tax=Shewanella sp. Isolate11 TaxID=2908530 RepID=UPI001EFC3287|nr:peptidoglycan editing factor PgeF [Shewanella sp. Isolate11]MCG9697756.1 peptidoglycan editing factor PgeF [Shewanella sp. Isolate11]
MLPADWQIPDGVKLAFSERTSGVSQPPFDSLNLGEHVGDDPQAVLQNRRLLSLQLGLTSEPAWLTQVHGIDIVDLDSDDNRTADGSVCRSTDHVCVVMTADCLPVLICDKQATQVAAVHAGWRGLCSGIIEAAVASFNAPADELYVYLGPCIGADAFEVGSEVRQAFVSQHPQTSQYFIPQGDKYFGDLQGIACYRTQALGVQHIYQLPHCTYRLSERYFSYRRDSVTGRMASLIWLEK